MGRTDIIRKQVEDVQDAIDDAFDAGQRARGARLIGVRDMLHELLADSEKVYRITASITYTVDIKAPDAESAEHWLWGLSDPIARMDQGELRVDDVVAVTADYHVAARVDSKGEEV